MQCAACKCVGLARAIYIRCTYGNFGREITKYTVIYGVYIWFWPTLQMCCQYRQKGEGGKYVRGNISTGGGTEIHCRY